MRSTVLTVVLLLVSIGYCQKVVYHDDFLFDTNDPLEHLGPCVPMLRLAGCKVLLADYELIRKDFPLLGTLSNSKIKSLLEEELCVIKEGQLSAYVNRMSTKFDIVTDERSIIESYQPDKERRSANIKSEKMGGWINIKGCGALHPAPLWHKHGYLKLPLALGEYFKTKIIEKSLAHSRGEYLSEKERKYAKVANITSVPYYGVMAYNHFGIFHENDKSYAGEIGVMIRKVHAKPQGYLSTRRDTEWAENILRSYGWTGDESGAFSGVFGTVGWVNTQMSTDKQLVDFSHYTGHRKFTSDAYRFAALVEFGCKSLHVNFNMTQQCFDRLVSSAKKLDLLVKSSPFSFHVMFPVKDDTSKRIWGIEDIAKRVLPNTSITMDSEFNDPEMIRALNDLLSIIMKRMDYIFRKYPLNNAQKIFPVSEPKRDINLLDFLTENY